MSTISHLLFICLQIVVCNGSSNNDHVSTSIADLLSVYVQRLACYKVETDLNALRPLFAEHVVHVAINTVLTQGELEGWEYVMDSDDEYGEQVQVPKFLLDTTLKNSPYIKLRLLEEDKSQVDNIQDQEILTVHELSSDFVTAVTTALSGAFKKLDEKEDFLPNKESLEKITTNIEAILDNGFFDAESLTFGFTQVQDFLDELMQSLFNQAALVNCQSESSLKEEAKLYVK